MNSERPNLKPETLSLKPSSPRWTFKVQTSAFLLAVLLTTSTHSQTPPVSTTRLQQLDSTYQTNLRKLHAPLLNDYERELETIKQKLIARNRDADARAFDEEIVRVRTIAATTGVLPYDAPKKLEPMPIDGTPPKPAKTIVPGLKKAGGDTIVLTAAEALPSAQFPLVMRNSPDKALQLGRASWKVPNVAAGTYDLILIYASASIPGGHSISANINGTDITLPLTVTQATGSDENFRLARIGQITFDKDVTDAPLTLHVEPFDASVLWLRSIALAKPKPKSKPETEP